MIPVGDDEQYHSWPYNHTGVLYAVSSDVDNKEPEFVETNTSILVPKKPNPIGFIWS